MRLILSILVSSAVLGAAPRPTAADAAGAASLAARSSTTTERPRELPEAVVREPAKKKKRRPAGTRASCFRALDSLGVSYKKVKRRRIAIGVRIRGPLGGVTYRSYNKRPLIIDCSLAVSLAVAGRFLGQHGIDSARYSSAHQLRNIRGTRRRSRHSFGLAIDVHTFSGEGIDALAIKEDYEQGLGDEIDCIGQPLTQAGAVLRAVSCQLERSGLFRTLLGPDYDAGHYNHFHIEARPWKERDDADADWQRVREAALDRE